MKTKWKVIGLILVLVIFILMALGSGSSSEKPKEITDNSTGETPDSDSTSVEMSENDPATVEDDTTSSNETDGNSVSSTTIEEQVLIDEEGLIITAKSYESDSIWGDGIKLLIENDTDKNIGIGCDALIVNDYMITDLFSSTVAAGKKANETMGLSSSQLEAAGIENVGKVEMYLHTFDPDSYITEKSFDCITITTNNIESMDTTPNDAGKELFNSNGVRIVGKYVDENSFWGAGILVYIENNSGRNVIVQCDDMAINGFMVTPFFSSTVYDGKKSIDDITILSSELEENGIESVEEVELVFKILDEESFSTIETSEPITFSAK